LKKIIGILGVLMAAAAYLTLIVQTATGTGEGLSLSTFGLWSALAWITGFTMLKKGANPGIVMMYGAGATTTTIILLIKGRFAWSGMDTIVAVVVAACVILWLRSGPMPALILSIVAAAIAAIPFIMICWKNPESLPIVANSGFLLANFLGFISAKAWTIQDRLYLGVNVVLCTLLVLPWVLM